MTSPNSRAIKSADTRDLGSPDTRWEACRADRQAHERVPVPRP